MSYKHQHPPTFRVKPASIWFGIKTQPKLKWSTISVLHKTYPPTKGLKNKKDHRTFPCLRQAGICLNPESSSRQVWPVSEKTPTKKYSYLCITAFTRLESLSFLTGFTKPAVKKTYSPDRNGMSQGRKAKFSTKQKRASWRKIPYWISLHIS